MNRYTTNKPAGNVEGYRNFVFIKDQEVYLRGMENDEDVSLDEYCKKQCKIKCDADYNDVPVDEFAEYLDCDCPISALYFAALGAAELRERLSRYEDTGLEPEDIKTITTAVAEPKPCSPLDTTEYHPIPVKEAKRITDEYGKNIVIIGAFDDKFEQFHITTFGKTAPEKLIAAEWGELIVKALGGDLERKVTYEDFRGGGNEGCPADQG